MPPLSLWPTLASCISDVIAASHELPNDRLANVTSRAHDHEREYGYESKCEYEYKFERDYDYEHEYEHWY